MAKHLHNIDRIFKEGQDGFEQSPPSAAWDKIQAVLDHTDAEKYRARFIWWKRIAVAMMVLFCLIIMREVVHTPTIAGNDATKLLKPSSLDSVRISSKVDKRVHNPAYNSINMASIRRPANRQAGAGYSSVKNAFVKQYNAGEQVPVNAYYKSVIMMHEQPACLPAAYGSIVRLKEYCLQAGACVAGLPSNVRLAPLPQALVNAAMEEVKKQPAINRRIQLAGVYVSADISQYMLDNDVPEDQRVNESERDDINHRETHEPSFTVGVFAEKPLFVHSGIKAGIAYAKTAIVIAPQQLVAVKQNGVVGYKYITSSGYALVQPNGASPAVGDSVTATEAQHRLNVVSVPVSFYYRFTKGRFIISPSAGLSANFITAARVQTEINNRGTKESVYINRLDGSRWFYGGAQLEVDVRYRIAGNWYIGVIPSFRCAFTAITKNNAVKTFPYTTGVAGSLVYKF